MDDFMHTTITMMTPILLAALGGLFTELSGMLNIGLEGMMLSSAFLSVYVASISNNLLIGIAAGLGLSIILALIMAYLSLNLKANVFIVGLATNLFASGLTVFLLYTLCNSKGTVFFPKAPKLDMIEIPVIHNIPILGKIISGYNILDYLAIVLVFVCFYIIFKTPYGYHLRAVGKDSQTAVSVGIVVSGLFAGLGGASLSLPLHPFVGGMTNRRGWIALVAVVLGRGNPIGVLGASIVFGIASALSNTLQASTDISPKLLLTVPFLVTLAVMIIYSTKRSNEDA